MTRVLEHYNTGMVLPVSKVYIVSHHVGDTVIMIVALTEQCDAYKMAREYNKKHGEHCVFSYHGDFVECSMDGTPDYYTVTELNLNKLNKRMIR